MALTQTLQQMRDGVRKLADIEGTSSRARHSDADLNDYINRALGSLHRRLTMAMPDQRILAQRNITTAKGVSTYGLPTGFDCLISIELTANGRRRWLTSYEMNERPMLTSPDMPGTGVPFCYRLRAGNIEFLPVPDQDYNPLLWFVPTASQLTADAQAYDTISRLDEYVIAYAARLVASKDRNTDVREDCTERMGELEGEIDVTARNRDRNSPPRIIDTRQRDRWGRSRCR